MELWKKNDFSFPDGQLDTCISTILAKIDNNTHQALSLVFSSFETVLYTENSSNASRPGVIKTQIGNSTKKSFFKNQLFRFLIPIKKFP